MRNGESGNTRRGGATQRGFGFLLVLFAVAAMGILLAGVGQVWQTTAQREKEAELLFVGNQFRQALASYLQASPGPRKQYPVSLQDLLEDRRFVVPVRHLRSLYPDPMTGDTQWGLVKAGDRIVAVHSRSEGVPLKTAFLARDAALANTASYAQWRFGPSQAGVAP